MCDLPDQPLVFQTKYICKNVSDLASLFSLLLIKNTFRNSFCDIDIYIFIYVYERICLNEFSRSKSSKLLQQFPPILPLRENYLSIKMEIKMNFF
jgi:hypothetical protein